MLPVKCLWIARAGNAQASFELCEKFDYGPGSKSEPSPGPVVAGMMRTAQAEAPNCALASVARSHLDKHCWMLPCDGADYNGIFCNAGSWSALRLQQEHMGSVNNGGLCISSKGMALVGMDG